MIADKNGGAALQCSDLETKPWFQSYSCPYPILTAESRIPLSAQIRSKSAASFEITTFELGSWDSAIYSFTPLRYLGAKFVNGQPTGKCITGFDDVGFLLHPAPSLMPP